MRLYLDKRSVGKDGKCPLRLVVRKDGQTAMPLTGIRVRPEDWDGERCLDPALDYRITELVRMAGMTVAFHRNGGDFQSMTLDDLVEDICLRTLIEPPARKRKDLLLPHMEDYRDRQAKKGTKGVYQRTIDLLKRYDPTADSLTFQRADFAYLCRFEKWCKDKGLKTNTVSIHIRNIRTVFNDAIASGLNVPSPFPRFKIKQEPTRKRCLGDEELRTLLTMDLPSDQERYRDYFLLMIYLIGINTVDLFTAKPSQIRDGRLEYVRQKTGKEYSVKLEPEALNIIKKYRGKKFLLEAMDNHEEFLSWRTQLNKRLKALGQVTGKRGKVVGDGPFPFLSTYWARHTWATLAYRLGVSVDVIGQALGHSDRSHAVTMIYIKPDARKVDKANRKVIDYIARLVS